MNIKTEITAKVMGEILAEGMNLCDVKLDEIINSEALDTLADISAILADKKAKSDEKVIKIENIIKIRETKI